MRLKISTPGDGGHFIAGSLASLYLDGVDVSQYIRRVVLTVDADEAISAEVTLYATAVDVDAPVAIKALVDEPIAGG